MGATDVCPFIPVSGMTMEECAQLAERLGKRVGEELKIPVYLYANAAKRPDRESLADIRKGEYEALPEKIKEDWFKPDFGPAVFNERCGATVIGARPFLIAYNVNLNTRSKKLAHQIALDIREAGKAKKDAEGKSVKDAQGKPIKEPGLLKACRAVGWYVAEYERAQISINLIDYKITSLEHAFDESCKLAQQLGLRVTGSEIVGMVPLEPMILAGRHYLKKQGRSTAVSDKELITVAVQSLGLTDLTPFDPEQKIIEYKVKAKEPLLKDKTVSDFLDELASESPAPGGGSVAALCGALSASLSAMVANLTFEKKGFEKQKKLLEETGVKGQALKARFITAIDADTQAFNRIIEARRMAKSTADEIADRDQAIFAANKEAIDVPMSVLKACTEALDIASTVIEHGNPNSLSDSGCAVLNAVAAAEGAYFNVLINAGGLGQEGQEGTLRRDSLKQATATIQSIRKTAQALQKSVLEKLEQDTTAQV
jgi:glutamate formiminotransferase/formiminotetrahydrofolate cyclodeaminase